MNPPTESYQSEGAAERRAQKALTERIGVTLVRRSRANNLKWSTWKWRFGMSTLSGRWGRAGPSGPWLDRML
jgi:hypothetical protein